MRKIGISHVLFYSLVFLIHVLFLILVEVFGIENLINKIKFVRNLLLEFSFTVA